MPFLARKPRARRHRNIAAALLLFVFLVAAGEVPRGADAGGTAAAEYQIKAVFLYNFAEFVDWPAGSFSAPNSPIVIGILGADPFGPSIDDAVRGEKVNGRSITIRRISRMDEVNGCHILFISRSEVPRLGPILEALKGRSILTVSDVEDYCRRGGMIELYTDRNKVRLRVNPRAAKEARLSISSKLLRPAQIVNTGMRD
jgi:hypothetical protein